MRPLRRFLSIVVACAVLLFLLVPTSRVLLENVRCVPGSPRTSMIPVGDTSSTRDVTSVLWPEVDEDTLSLSEHPDIDIRGKFQKERIKNFCRKHFYPGEQHFPIETHVSKLFHRHLIFEEHTRSMYCFVPKIGCTNMKRLMLYMGGHLPRNTIEWPWVDDTTYIEPALKHASLMNATLTKVQRVTMIQSYYKFMIVRNPLERLVSGYRNKIEPPLDYEKQDAFPHKIKKNILLRYRLTDYLYWQGAPKTKRADLNVTFSEFVHYVIDMEKEELNEHVRPSMDICHPCLVQYDFYSNFRTISHDAQALIKKFGTDPLYYRDESLHSPESQTFQLLQQYYGQLAPREKVKLLGAWYDELTFYYTLYPSERYSHMTLLGIDHPVL